MHPTKAKNKTIKTKSPILIKPSADLIIFFIVAGSHSAKQLGFIEREEEEEKARALHIATFGRYVQAKVVRQFYSVDGKLMCVCEVNERR